jgi:CAAX prenyl protease-like protein
VPIWLRLRIAALVAGVSFLSAAPYVYYVASIAFADRIRARFPTLDQDELLRLDMISIALVVIIAALVGALFSERYELRGLGDLGDLRRARGLILGFGPPMMIASYLVFGRPLAQAVPGYYPTSIGWAVVLVLKGAIFDEVVARYGMMTIIRGVAPRTVVANVLQALFFTAVGFKSMTFFGLEAAWSTPFVLGIVASFLVHLVQGALYARHGLVAACCLHLILELKLVVHAIVES